MLPNKAKYTLCNIYFYTNIKQTKLVKSFLLWFQTHINIFEESTVS